MCKTLHSCSKRVMMTEGGDFLMYEEVVGLLVGNT